MGTNIATEILKTPTNSEHRLYQAVVIQAFEDCLYTLGGKNEAYNKADIIIVCTPTNYDLTTGEFDTQTVEAVVNEVLTMNQNASIFIKSTVPVGFTNDIRKKFQTNEL